MVVLAGTSAHCAERGDEVVTLDRSGDEPIDITDREATHAALAKHEPAVVYHLAALSHVGDSWSDPSAVYRVNIEGTAHVLDVARAAAVGRVVMNASAEEYGRADAADLRCARRPLTDDAVRVSKIAASYLAAAGASRMGST
jgi:nucleoside-diphosphate-sugar epimerase